MSEASKGDSSGNGLAEHAVREIKAKTRGLRLQVEAMHNVTLVQTDAIVVWMVLFASMIINIAMVVGGKMADPHGSCDTV
eukprot:4602372-Amphidinium_carterae.1